jgi:hypothetical protein
LQISFRDAIGTDEKQRYKIGVADEKQRYKTTITDEKRRYKGRKSRQRFAVFAAFVVAAPPTLARYDS